MTRARRAGRTVARWTARGAIGVGAAWLLSRVVGDINVAAQVLLWTPSWAYAMLALTLAGLSWCVAMASRPPETDPDAYADAVLRRPVARRERWIAAACACVIALWMSVVEWRLVNAIAGPAPAARERTVRIANWNPCITFMDPFPAIAARWDADIALIANPPARVDWTLVRDAFGPARDAARAGRFAVVSRFPIRRWGWGDLRVRGSEPQVHRWTGGGKVTIDTGQALWLEFETETALGKPLVVWFIDMPSDPRVARARAFREAAIAAATWRGNAMERSNADAEAPMTVEAYVARFGAEGFPKPDVIVGDFNTPRGAPSIRSLVPAEMRSAHAQAGYGAMGTWPRSSGVFGLDQAFTADWLAVTGYEVIDEGIAEHRAQVIDVTAR